ncbi:MAG: phage terminase large subunit family protein [Nitrospiraceae bacterium]
MADVALQREHLWPDVQMRVSEWADAHRILDRFTSAEPGPWRTDRAPYLREIMDAFTRPDVEDITLCCAAQMGKSSAELNMIGFVIDQVPAPTMVVLPRDEDTKGWGDRRLRPMIESSDALRRHTTGKEDDLAGKIFRFDRMFVKLAGANSPADLASDPIRFVFFDEVDKYPKFSGRESSPLKLGTVRARTFWNRKIVKASTPTVEHGAIWQELLRSNFQRYHVPCPLCGAFQPLTFRHDPKLKTGMVKWEKGATKDELLSEKKRVWYECGRCAGEIYEAEKIGMVEKGVWCPDGCDVIEGKVIGAHPMKSHVGFHISALYSPWMAWRDVAAEFVETKDDSARLMGFVNSTLAEPWNEPTEEKVESDVLFGRREQFDAETMPDDVAVITAGVDVQVDRLEMEVIGWGRKEESWSLEYKIFRGDPASLEVWNDLDVYLQRTYAHPSGVQLRIVGTCIDSGGLHTQQVYNFVRGRQFRRVHAIKGSKDIGRPIVGRPTLTNLGKIKLFIIGTDTAKDVIFSRLRLKAFGPGYMHYPVAYDEEFFRQLTAEKITTKLVKGFLIRSYEKIYPRNEALDCRVYGYAALVMLNTNLDVLADQLKKRMDERKLREELGEDEPAPRKRRPRRSGGFAGRFTKK